MGPWLRVELVSEGLANWFQGRRVNTPTMTREDLRYDAE